MKGRISADVIFCGPLPLPQPPRAVCLVPSPVLGRGGRLGANETVRIGVIGCGGRARTLVNQAKE